MSALPPDESMAAPATAARTLPEPRERIDPRALRAWRLSGALGAACLLVISGATSYALTLLDLPWYIVALPVAIALVVGGVLVWLVPTVIWRRWRYEVSQHEIDLQYGFVVITRTLVPMSRVQHVDTRQGPILRHYGLATVAIATAAGVQEIPALAVDVAESLRNRIAELANIADDV